MLPYARAFARHETFHPRYGWLRKAVVESSMSPDVFVRADATVSLGVGKNMVRAIRYWASACGLIEQRPLADRPRLAGSAPTQLGLFLLGPDGADPYLEELSSLWLLHWQLVRMGSMAAVWYLTFNRFPHREFTDDLLADWLCRDLTVDGVTDVARGSIEKDVSCLLRMYGPVPGDFPETLVSPFANLRLIDRIEGKPARHRITYGPKSGLPVELVAIVALDQLSTGGPETRSIGLASLATAESSPGKVFALPENELATALEEAGRTVAGFEVGIFAGARRLMLTSSVEAAVAGLLARLYPRRPFDIDLDDLRRTIVQETAA
ncbi:MAG TPA: DUF4007 family protein [Candidatus Limnocylindrales bacterium]|jgi:hypothetical protein|nr:DUF4007 family protein [Candidatus Limnocylindrales bacterium]